LKLKIENYNYITEPDSKLSYAYTKKLFFLFLIYSTKTYPSLLTKRYNLQLTLLILNHFDSPYYFPVNIQRLHCCNNCI